MRRFSQCYGISNRSVRLAHTLAWSGLVAAVLLWVSAGAVRAAEWIWSPQHAAGQTPQGACYFRTTFLGGDFTAAKLTIAGDDEYEVYLNGRRIIQGAGWKEPKTYNIAPHAAQDENTLAIKVTNTEGRTAGLLVSVELTQRDGQTIVHASDDTWKTTVSPFPLWHLPRYADTRWELAQSLGKDGQAKPWIRDQAITAVSNGAANTTTPASTVSNTTPVDTTDNSAAVEAPSAPTAGDQPPAATPANDPTFRSQPDFEVQILAAHEQTGSLIAMEFNEFNELLLAQENGPLLLMVDTNNDKIPDSPRIYCDEVKNVQGILPLNGDVFVTADGPQGAALYQLSDKNRDGKLNVVKTLVKFRHAMDEDDSLLGEHGPHGLAIGPDGNIYIVVGNHARVDGDVAGDSAYTATYEGDIVPRFEDPGGHASGVKAPGGTVLRIPVAGGKVERIAGGLRNAYDLAFDQWGNLLTHDSDMEADEGTTWYRPTRVSHIIPGGEYGWRSGWAKWSDRWHDGLPPMIETGRGSPTGVVVYDHFMFPEKFQHGIFVCDWTHGRISHINAKPQGATLTATSETLLEGQPLTITDLTVGPDGWLYFVSGGRDTAGGVYRLVYTGKTPTYESRVGKGVSAAIRYPQFQSAWARQAIAKIKHDEGERWNAVLPAVARTSKNSTRFRTRALDLMHLYGPPIDSEQLIQLSQDDDPHVRAKVADLMGLREKAKFEETLIAMLTDDEADVRRRACAALVRCGGTPTLKQLTPLLVSADRFEAFAARRVLERIPVGQWQAIVLASDDHRLFIQGATALLVVQPDKATAKAVLDRFTQLLPGYITDDDFIDMLRLAQIALDRGDIQPADAPEFARAMSDEFPASNVGLNRELLRLLVALDVTSIGDRYIKYLQSDLEPAEQLQVVLHLALLETEWTSEQRMTLLAALDKAQQVPGGSSRAGYVNNVTRQFAGQLTPAEQQQVLARATQMPTAALAVLFHLESPDAATLKSLEENYVQLQDETSKAADQLQIGIIAILGESGDAESMDFLRNQYPLDPDKQAYLAMALAQQPDGANWPLLIDALHVVDGGAARMVLQALATVDQAPEEAEPYRFVIIRGLELAEAGGGGAIELLEHWTGENPLPNTDDAAKKLTAWQAWFAKRWPQEPPAVLPTATAASKWIFDDLLAHLYSDTAAAAASADRGAHVFAKAQCSKCHRYGDDGDTVGPDLTAISQRFRKKEILESVLYPSHVISDQYRAKTVISTSGRQYTGIIAAGAPGEVVVLQQDGRKVVLKQDQVDETLPSKLSAMPDGLLENLTLEEVTDLFTYLAKPPAASTAQRPKRD